MPDVHTTPGLTSDIVVSCPSGTCSATTMVTSVTPDAGHSNFAFDGVAMFAGDPTQCPVRLTAKLPMVVTRKNKAKPKKKKDKDGDSLGAPDPGAVTVTLTSEPAPQGVDVNYVL